MEQKFDIKAVGDYCLVKQTSTDDQVVGGVLISTSQNSLFATGEIISVGKGEKIEKLGLNTGDIIFYNDVEKNTVSSDITHEGYVFVRSDFIYGIKLK